jgi:DNA-binding response OmpR family regulator
VINLLSNAFKFTPNGGKIDFLATINPNALVESPSKVLELKVGDNGIGMEKEEVEKIFDRFYQADSTHTRKKEGSGIGLALTKELVDLHQGKITVESEILKGTAFTIRLPLNVQDEIFEKSPLPVQKGEMEAFVLNGQEFKTMNTDESPVIKGRISEEKPILLIVEDNQDLSAFIASYFQRKFQVIETSNGKEGLDTEIKIIPDIIISDVMMPEIDGIELCGKLKTDHRTSHIPLILLTAKAGEKNKLNGLETGADDYLTKPFSGAELKIRVHNLIEGRKRLRERYSREVRLQPSEMAITSADEKFLENIMAILEANFMEATFTLEHLEKEAGLSRTQFYRKLKALTDQPPGEFLRNFRLQKAAMLLKGGQGNITDVAYEVGFNSLAYFTRCFKEFYKKSPSEFLATHSASEPI